jgi:hypothetical protein
MKTESVVQLAAILAGLYLACFGVIGSIHFYDEKQARTVLRPHSHVKVDGVFEMDKKGDDSSSKGRIKMATFVFGEKAASKPYLQMFLESARDSGVDIAIVGSPEPPFALPPNVQHVPLTWEQFASLVSTRLFGGHPVKNLPKASPYKVIDFKPLFAYLFPELVSGYEWWGHMDNDLMLGDVRRFLTPEILEQNDIISGVHKKSWGPFTLYRNSNVTNDLFKLAPGPLRRIFDNETALFFDEWGKVRYFDNSMTGIITKHAQRLGLRWHGDFPVGWDGECKKRINRGKKRCSECSFTLPQRNDGISKQRLIQDQSEITPGCTPHSDEDKCQREVMLCHFEMGKLHVEASLVDPKFRSHLIENKRWRVSFLEGFTPFPSDANSTSIQGEGPVGQ